jgi:hypothetical protein
VIDEFHHVFNAYYQNIVKYFKSKMFLELIAMPDS